MRLRLSIAALMLAVSCAPDAERRETIEPSGPNVESVNGLMAAFNKHDANKMRTYWHDDVTWIEITGNQSSVVTESAEQLHRELVAYFENYPEVSSSLESVSVNGDYLTAIERPVWVQDGEKKSQASYVVYQFEDGKVKRFWYFPPQ